MKLITCLYRIHPWKKNMAPKNLGGFGGCLSFFVWVFPDFQLPTTVSCQGGVEPVWVPLGYRKGWTIPWRGRCWPKIPNEFVDQWKFLEIYVIQKKYIIYTYLSIYSPIIFLNFLFWDDMTLLKQKLCTDFFKQKIESITGVTASTLPLTIEFSFLRWYDTLKTKIVHRFFLTKNWIHHWCDSFHSSSHNHGSGKRVPPISVSFHLG